MEIFSVEDPMIVKCRWLILRKRSCLKYLLTVICGYLLLSMVLRRGDYDTKGSTHPQKDQTSPVPIVEHLDPKQLLDESWKSDELAELAIRHPILGSPMCPLDPPGLGLGLLPTLEIVANMTKVITNPGVSARHEARNGGWWQPSHCQTNHHTAIIIPYRDREENLEILLHYLHPMLQRQLLHYRIFVAEQDGNGTYNKGRIMNSAFTIVRSFHPSYNCFVFHDVDMIPEDDRNLYICGDQPRHLSPAVDKFNYTLPYKELIGGVLALTANQFVAVNGYANVFWGWGGEDDDMQYRIRNKQYRIMRPSMEIGRYTMLAHVRRTWISHKKTYDLLGRWKSRQKVDGVSNIKYKLLSMETLPLYTHLLIRISNEETPI